MRGSVGSPSFVSRSLDRDPEKEATRGEGVLGSMEALRVAGRVRLPLRHPLLTDTMAGQAGRDSHELPPPFSSFFLAANACFALLVCSLMRSTVSASWCT